MPRISLSRFTLLVCCISAVYFAELGTARLWDRDEPRNSRASHEMLARGDWVVPTFNGELRDHKPILLYWGQMTAYSVFGESEFTARLPSALAAILSIIAVAVLATRLSGTKTGINQEGFWAAGALATCMLFVMAGRAATPDALLVAFSTIGIALLVIASLRPASPFSSGNVGAARWLPAMLAYGSLGLAALAKGPVGIVLPLAVVHIWWLLCKPSQASQEASSDQLHSAGLPALLNTLWQVCNPINILRAAWALRVLPGMLVCLLVAAPWYVLVGLETDGAFLRGFFIDHNVGRAIGSMEGHNGSIFFYPAAFIAGTFPWSLWLLPVILWCVKSAKQSPVQRQLVMLSISWIAVYVGAFSLASTKLPSYITPCYAGAALAIGSFFRQYETAWCLPSINWRRAGYAVTAVVGLVLIGAFFWGSQQTDMPLLKWTCLAGVVIVLLAVVGWVLELRNQLHLIPPVWLTGAAAFQVILFGVGAANVNRYRGDLQMLSDTQRAMPAERWIAAGGFEPSWVHYLDQQFVELTGIAKAGDPGLESWAYVDSVLGESPAANMVVVGEDKKKALEEFLNGTPVNWRATEIASSKVFLKDNVLTVFRLERYSSIATRPSDTLPRNRLR